MNQISITYNQGPRVEIRGHEKKQYTIKFYNNETDELIFSDSIHNNHFSRAYAEYMVLWKIVIESEGKIVKEEILNLNNKIVFVAFESSALGDSIAWVPYVNEFQRKYNCVVYCSTFYNHLFVKKYPNVNFVQRNHKLTNTYATYRIGWFGAGSKSNKNKVDCRTIPLQELVADTLNIIPYQEIRPTVSFDERAPLYNNSNYVVISVGSTAQAKYWNNPVGWQQLVDWLNERGYKVVAIGREKNKLKNVINKTGNIPIFDCVNLIQHSKFFVGISSGLTWLTWSLGMKSVMISGFTAPWFEFQEDNYRVHNSNVCNSCFTDPKHKFNRGDWQWCPVNKNTRDHFICSKSINRDMVIEKIVQLEEDLKLQKNQTRNA